MNKNAPILQNFLDKGLKPTLCEIYWIFDNKNSVPVEKCKLFLIGTWKIDGTVIKHQYFGAIEGTWIEEIIEVTRGFTRKGQGRIWLHD